MRFDHSQLAIDQKLIELRQTDPAGAAAFALRHKGICPACGRHTITVSGENAVSGTRAFSCSACQWAATVTEAEWRGNPTITLRAICEEAKRAARLAARPRATPRPSTPYVKPKTPEIASEAPKTASQKDARGGDERNDGRDKPADM